MSAAIHASAVLIGEAGVLILGPSGAGKSALSLALIEAARARNGFASLIADDRVVLAEVNGRVLATAKPDFEGLIERRGEGILRVPFEPAAVLRLVVDLPTRGLAPVRWPEENGRIWSYNGVILPRMTLDIFAGAWEASLTILRRIQSLSGESAAFANFA